MPAQSAVKELTVNGQLQLCFHPLEPELGLDSPSRTDEIKLEDSLLQWRTHGHPITDTLFLRFIFGNINLPVTSCYIQKVGFMHAFLRKPCEIGSYFKS